MFTLPNSLRARLPLKVAAAAVLAAAAMAPLTAPRPAEGSTVSSR